MIMQKLVKIVYIKLLVSRSGVALAMCHRQQWHYHLRAHGLRKGDELPAYTQ